MNGTCDVGVTAFASSSLLQHTPLDWCLGQLAAAARRIMTHRFKLGLFDDPRGSEYFSGIYNETTTVHSDKHADLAREAAQQGIVIVQNPPRTSDGLAILPLSAEQTKSMALIGPMGEITDAFLGDYRPAACPGPAKKAPEGTACLPTLRTLLARRAPSIALHVANGCGNGSQSVPCTPTSGPVTPAVTSAMQASEIIVLAIGEKVTDNDDQGDTASEGRDEIQLVYLGDKQILLWLPSLRRSLLFVSSCLVVRYQ